MAMHKYVAAIVTSLVGLSLVWAADWPQFLGPNRNGSSPETGLLTTWPADGPKVLWKVEGGIGYSGIAVAGGKAITLVSRGGDELVLALDTASGKELWKTKSGPTFVEDQGSGPRSTPTIDGKRVYVQSASGPLLCLEADSGKIVWQVDLLKEFAAKNITWGLCASPLIVGDLVLAEPGGKGAGVAAFNKDTGKLAWKLGDDSAAYASPISVMASGKPQVIFFTATGLLGVELTGKELWRVPWHTDYDCNIATPLPIGDQLFVSSGEKVGCAMFKLGAAKPSVVWDSKGAGSVMITYWANGVVQDKHLYGIAGEYNVKNPDLRCIDIATGKQAWTQSQFGKGNPTLADGHLFINTVAGDLVLVAASPKSFQEKGRVKKLLSNDRFSAAPTIADKKLYLRDSKSILCLDIAGK
jgi:outer membrane protein assembly factor BamB